MGVKGVARQEVEEPCRWGQLALGLLGTGVAQRGEGAGEPVGPPQPHPVDRQAVAGLVIGEEAAAPRDGRDLHHGPALAGQSPRIAVEGDEGEADAGASSSSLARPAPRAAAQRRQEDDAAVPTPGWRRHRAAGGARRPWFEGHGASEPGRVHGHPSRRRASAWGSPRGGCVADAKPIATQRIPHGVQRSPRCRRLGASAASRSGRAGSATPVTSPRGPQIPSTPVAPRDGARRLGASRTSVGPSPPGPTTATWVRATQVPRRIWSMSASSLLRSHRRVDGTVATARISGGSGNRLRRRWRSSATARTRQPSPLEGTGVLGLLRGIRALSLDAVRNRGCAHHEWCHEGEGQQGRARRTPPG